MRMAINQTLKKLGLNEKEIKVYLTLLKHGKSKPGSLAILTKLNRATLYNVADGLMSKGIIAEDLSGKSRELVPLPVGSLEKMLGDAKRELKEKEALVKEAIGELNMITAEKSYPVPKIRFIEENDLEKFLFDNMVRWEEAVIASDGVWWGFQDHSFVENFEKWIHASWATPLGDKFSANIFTNFSQAEEKLKGKHSPKRKVRFLPGLNFTSTVWVCGDYLIMTTTRQHPFYLVEIHDQTLAHNMREVLKKLWSADIASI